MKNSIDFQWLGLYVDFYENNKIETIKVEFSIKLLKNINNSSNLNFGLKTHEPVQYINNWLFDCPLNDYYKVELNVNIIPKNQYIILNFDNYLDELEFYIKNFKIII